MASDSAELDALLRVRKERLHSTMLVEILTLLVFLAMGFALVSRDELSAQPLADKVERLEGEIAKRDAEIRKLRTSVNALKIANEQIAESLRRFVAQSNGTLRANDRVVILPQDQFTDLTSELSNKTSLIEERQKEAASLRARLAATGRGGTDLPPCAVTPGFLLQVDLLAGGGFQVKASWAATAQQAALAVSGIREMTVRGTMGNADFQRLAGLAQSWGRAQPTPCGFRVKVRARHSNLDAYLRQHRVVARYFYTAW